MRPLRYLPYDETTDVPNVVVDGSPNRSTVLTLTHWPGIPSPPDVEADLSAQMAFRYLDRGGDLHGDAEVVTNNHFDQDGLVGIFALVDPETALANRDLLTDVAAAGDFGTYRHRTAARIAMALVQLRANERYVAGIELLPQMVADIERFRDLWGDEDDALTATEQALDQGLIRIDEEPELDLAVVSVDDAAPDPGGHRFAHVEVAGPHPMAINNATGCFRVVVVRGRRYEVTFRYETWVQYRSRRPLPRVDLAPLAAELQADDPGAGWTATGPGDLTPTLRLAAGRESALSADDFLARLRHHLRTAAPAWDPYDGA
jgi:hypothetical protein